MKDSVQIISTQISVTSPMEYAICYRLLALRIVTRM
nr:MAG TPA: hypothetical protein [Caudoviricetes sp.]